ncbi:MAG: hypothetical protein Q9M92_04090 [Enterobacterales bacterium]|nr:hypothetical protein [Enterobacterales bacterium]
MPISGKLFSQWLHGAKASNLKADINVKFRPTKTHFDQFSDYNYDDPAREFNAQKQQVYSDYLDEEGNMSFQVMLRPKGKPAGMLNAFFTSRVFEQGGAFSSESQKNSLPPLPSLCGYKIT